MLSASILSKAVRERQFNRWYLAIVRGTLPQTKGIIDAPISRVDDSIITRTVDFEKGEKAITHYEVVAQKAGHSLLKIKLETGRTHQIRVHFKYIGYPLIGDYLYNPDMQKMTRQALHSSEIAFTHPITGEYMHFSAPLPVDMAWVLF